jgi:hypothetical protein
MVSIKRAIIFGAIPAAVVVTILILVATFYTKQVYTEIDIQAPKQRVWKVVTNISDFHRWNPFMNEAIGEIRIGAPLNIHLQPPNAKGMNIDVVITKIDPNNELRWLGVDGIPGLFDGEHIFTIESVRNNNNSTHFIQREVFNGILVPFFAYQLDTNYTPGFKAMNHALKTEAERASI